MTVGDGPSSPVTPGAGARIVVVDDKAANLVLLSRVLERWGYTDVTTTMDTASVVSLCEEVRPDLLMLDLHMPAPDGFAVMELLDGWIRGPERLPILVLTADPMPETKRRALAAGARDFLTKPFDPTEVGLRVGNLLEMRRLQVELQEQNVSLERRVRDRTKELERARLETLERLALAGEYRDDDTNEHAKRVGRTVARLAAVLGLSEGEIHLLRRAAPLHDVGKIGVPDLVLLKPGKLTPEEYDLMKTHTTIGEQMLSGTSYTVLEASATVALTHHERWDGGGYPRGLAGEEIPLAGRLTALADVFDALTHSRPYKEAWPVERAVAEIVGLSGAHFDPAIVEAFGALDASELLAPVARDELDGHRA